MMWNTCTKKFLFAALLTAGIHVSAQEAPEAGPVLPGPAEQPEGRPQVRQADDDLISLDFNKAPIEQVLHSLAGMRDGVNMVIGPDVEGTITFKLDNVEWELALRLITEAHGLTVTKEGENIYRVATRKEQEGVEKAIVVELYTLGDIRSLSSDAALKLLGDPEVTDPEQAKGILLRHPSRYVKQISVDSRGAVDVVRMLAQKAGLNFTFSADSGPVSRGKDGEKTTIKAEDLPPISLNLRNLPVEDALLLIAEQGGLLATNRNGVWAISPMTPEQREVEPLKLETFQVKFIPLDKDLVSICEPLISDRGTVSSGKNKILIVKDTAEGIAAVKQALQVMDRPTPQVLIEARFFELQKGASKNLGIDWNVLGTDGVAVNMDPLTYDYSKTIERGDNDSDTNTNSNSFEMTRDLATGAISGSNTESAERSNQIEEFENEAVESVRSALLDVNQFGVVLHALKSNLGAKQLSNPKIVVSSEQQATIHIGDQQPIVKSSIESSEGGDAIRTFELDPDYGGQVVEEAQLVEGARTSQYKTRKGYLDLGTKLTVAPSVKTEDQIYIRVVPELTSLVGFESFGSGTSLTRYPKLFTTRVRTQFTINSGQTIAIGGLVSERTKSDISRVPLLGSIPGLKRLFSYETEDKEQTETVIFLTVKMISSEELVATSGVPIRSYLVQPELERIAREDAAGAEYSPERARQILRELRKKGGDEKWLLDEGVEEASTTEVEEKGAEKRFEAESEEAAGEMPAEEAPPEPTAETAQPVDGDGEEETEIPEEGDMEDAQSSESTDNAGQPEGSQQSEADANEKSDK
mgnify:CR=1 FL=1